MYFTSLYPRERSSEGYIGITLSVHRSVQVPVRPITFLWFDIVLPYLAHGCSTMRRCVTYIHDPDTTLNFYLKVKFIGVLTCFCVRPITFFWIDIGLPYLAYGSIDHHEKMWHYIHVPDSMLSFDIMVKFIGFCHVFMSHLWLLLALMLAYHIWHISL